MLRTAWTVLYIVKPRICSKCANVLNVVMKCTFWDLDLWYAENLQIHRATFGWTLRHVNQNQFINTALWRKVWQHSLAIKMQLCSHQLFLINKRYIRSYFRHNTQHSSDSQISSANHWDLNLLINRMSSCKSNSRSIMIHFIKAVLYMHSGTFSCLTFVKGEIWHVGQQIVGIVALCWRFGAQWRFLLKLSHHLGQKPVHRWLWLQQWHFFTIIFYIHYIYTLQVTVQ